MAYRCRYAAKFPNLDYLICTKRIIQGKEVGIKQICGFQYECPVTRSKENTEGAKKCALNK